jgi:mannose-6-phosphate isomerase-like protein (cupin superfamily)
MRAIACLGGALAALALLVAQVPVGLAQGTGEGAWRDSLRTRPRLGGGVTIVNDGYPDGDPLSAPAAGAPSARSGYPGLAVEQLRLQEVLAQHLLREEENARSVNMVAIDSLLALDLYQLRGAEAPHVYPASDLWVYIWRGRGRFLREVGTAAYAPGELLQIPAGTAYALENESGAPTVALVWQWPPIDETLTRALPPAVEDAPPLWEALRSEAMTTSPAPPR